MALDNLHSGFLRRGGSHSSGHLFFAPILCRYENIPSPIAIPTGRCRRHRASWGREPRAKGVTARLGSLYAARNLCRNNWLESCKIRLNPVACWKTVACAIESEVPHELAHLLVWKHFGRVAQRANWDDGKRAGRSAHFVRISSNCNPCAAPSPTAASAGSISLPYAVIIA